MPEAMSTPDGITPSEIKDEVRSTLEFLRRQVDARRKPDNPPASVEERLAAIRRQVQILREKHG